MEILLELLPPEVSPIGAAGLLVVSIIGSALTAGLGIGGGVFVMAVMLTFLSPAVVLPAHGVVQIGSNGGRALLMRNDVRWTIFAWFVAGSVVGIIAGSQLFVALPERLLLAILGVFVLYTVWAPKLRKRMLGERWYALIGALSSFATLFVGATGPLVGAFWSPERMGRHALVATHGACMTVQHGLKVLAFGLLGFALAAWVPLLAAMIASGFIGTVVGKKLLDRTPPERFALGFRLTLTALALRLLWQAAA